VPVPPATSYSAGSLTLNAGSSLTLDPAKSPYRFHDGTIRANIIVPVGTTSHIDIYFDGTLSMTAGGVVNNTSDPSLITIWGCGASSTTWQVLAGTNAYFALYAPTHPIDLKAGSNIYGAIVGASLTSSGSATLHFDEALKASPSVVLIPGSWTEITR
jgi:hypothetical protein